MDGTIISATWRDSRYTFQESRRKRSSSANVAASASFIGYWQLAVAAGLAAWFCFMLVVFFEVDCPLQSLALPPSCDVPLLPPPLLEAPLVPLLLAPPLLLLVFEPLDELEPEDEPELLSLPLCWPTAAVARPSDSESTETESIFRNMIFSLGVINTNPTAKLGGGSSIGRMQSIEPSSQSTDADDQRRAYGSIIRHPSSF